MARNAAHLMGQISECKRVTDNQQPNSFRTGPDAEGRFGKFGGRFVAETLMPLVLALEKEYGRAVVGWNREGNARVAMDACGGTVGQGSCVHLRQCYQADGPVTFEQLTAEESDLQWEQSSCATTPLRVEEAPEESEVEFEMSAEEMDIPGEFDESQMVEGM